MTVASRTFVVATIVWGAVAAPLRGQSVGELGAFSALVLSPAAALVPLARDNAGGVPDRTELSLRYVRWRYDIDDGVHSNFGATLAERLGRSGTTISVTAAYLTLSCDCSVWLSGGASIHSTLWQGALGSQSNPGPSAHVAIIASGGGARFSGDGHATAASAHVAFDLGTGFKLLGSRLALSVFPGVGAGRIASEDETSHGVRPTIGAAMSWSLGRGIMLDAGTQIVALAGGPTQFGAGVSWRRR